MLKDRKERELSYEDILHYQKTPEPKANGRSNKISAWFAFELCFLLILRDAFL
jgi:hypothetical protein